MTKNDIEQALRDYFWMPREIERIKKDLEDIDTSTTAMYGIEASMPKAQGMNGDKVGKSVERREKEHRYLNKLKNKMELIESNIDVIDDDLEKAVLFCTLDGMSQVAISQHLALSEGKVSNLKNRIVNQIHDQVAKASV